MVEGSLPEWLAALATGLGAHAAAAPPDVAASSWQERLAERTEAWVDSLGTVSAVNMFTALADANSDADNVLRYLMFYRRYYRSTEDALRPQDRRFEYNLGRRLLDRGLIGTIDPVAAGVVPEWQHDVEATAYVDAFQFLSRAASDDLGRLPEGQADLVRLLALKLGHGHVTGNLAQLVAAHLSERPDRANYEVALLAAEFAEELGNVDKGVQYRRLAVAVAQELETSRGGLRRSRGRHGSSGLPRATRPHAIWPSRRCGSPRISRCPSSGVMRWPLADRSMCSTVATRTPWIRSRRHAPFSARHCAVRG